MRDDMTNSLEDISIRPADHGCTLLAVHGIAVLLTPRQCEQLAVRLLERAAGANAPE
jgi:hypothetical protein